MNLLIEARGVHFDYGREPVLAGVDVELRRGELVGLLGRNGSGKTTLLRLLLGLIAPRRGEVRLSGDRVDLLPRREVARRVAWVPSDAQPNFGFRLRELVAMGRNPHLGAFRPEGERDRALVADALAATDLASFGDRPIPELSAGEWRRALVARALAQETPGLLLDEPTAHLDVAHQLELLELLRSLAAEGRAILAALHDLGLAARFCDRVIVLAGGTMAAVGPPPRVLTEANLSEFFGIRATVRQSEVGLAIHVEAAASPARPGTAEP